MQIFIIYFAFLALMWWWLSRGNKKRKAEEERKQSLLAPGTYVMLKDGLYGTVVDMDDSTIVVNISVDGADEGCVCFSRESLNNILEGDAIPYGPGHDEVRETVVTTEYSAGPDIDASSDTESPEPGTVAADKESPEPGTAEPTDKGE